MPHINVTKSLASRGFLHFRQIEETLLSMISHPTTPCSAINSIQASYRLFEDKYLKIRYVLNGKLQNIIIPETRKSTFVDKLWEHTCFEAFIGIQDETLYHEYNFSPSTQWAAYAFSDYRQKIDWHAHQAPIIDVEQTKTQLSLLATLSIKDLPKNPNNKPLQLGLTAVVKTIANKKSYWALKHPVDKPDFHDKNGFILTL